jgi:hypothetical protein
MSGTIHRETMKECIIVTNGCLHSLETDKAALLNFFNDKSYKDNNRWKSMYCKKRLYFFSLNNTIILYAINVYDN